MKFYRAAVGHLTEMEAGDLVHSLGADSQYRCVKFEEKKSESEKIRN